jgi:hypothetical protein
MSSSFALRSLLVQFERNAMSWLGSLIPTVTWGSGCTLNFLSEVATFGAPALETSREYTGYPVNPKDPFPGFKSLCLDERITLAFSAAVMVGIAVPVVGAVSVIDIIGNSFHSVTYAGSCDLRSSKYYANKAVKNASRLAIAYVAWKLFTTQLSSV